MSADTPRRIAVLRHAKSDHPTGMGDRERPLAERGRQDASAAGRWLAASAIAPDLCLCSYATRTRETWALASRELPRQPTTVYAERVYEASYTDLVELLRETSDEVGTVLVVGHNPGMHALAIGLAGDNIQNFREPSLLSHFPTSAIAVLTANGSWGDLEEGTCSLDDFWTPR